MITGKLYDWLKWITQIVLPAVGTLYFTLAGIWGLPSANEVVGTIMAVDLFLGVMLGISQVNYGKTIENAGDLLVDEEGKMVFRLDGDRADIDALAEKREVRFCVKKTEGEIVEDKRP